MHCIIGHNFDQNSLHKRYASQHKQIHDLRAPKTAIQNCKIITQTWKLKTSLQQVLSHNSHQNTLLASQGNFYNQKPIQTCPESQHSGPNGLLFLLNSMWSFMRFFWHFLNWFTFILTSWSFWYYLIEQ